MREEFYVVLPSDSSMQYYPDNTVARFTTQLPEEIKLQGRWVVGLTEFSFPYTFSNIYSTTGFHLFVYSDPEEKYADVALQHNFIPKGHYKKSGDLIDELNNISKKYDVFFKLNNNGHVSCFMDSEKYTSALIQPMKLIREILGFDSGTQGNLNIKKAQPVFAKHPMNLHATIPRELYVYSDICEPYIVGDVHTPLITKVNIDFSKFDYWGVQVKSITTPRYLPLLTSRFRTILIDIRDSLGEPAPFEGGRSNITLHFKKIL